MLEGYCCDFGSFCVNPSRNIYPPGDFVHGFRSLIYYGALFGLNRCSVENIDTMVGIDTMLKILIFCK